jgi:hypothetical protein
MVSAAWQARVCGAVVEDGIIPPRPLWDNAVPCCVERCPHHDGKRCRLTGFQPGAICEPVVRAMGLELAKVRT